MDSKERHDFFKDLYDKEFIRKDNLENSLNIPITITTAITVLIYFLMSEYENGKLSTVLDITFYSIIAIAASTTLIGIFFLIKLYVNIFHKKYRAIPYADQLENYRVTLANYYTTNAAALPNTSAINLFHDYLTDQYIQQTATNTIINDTKRKELEITKRALTISLFLIILSFLPFFYNFFKKPDKVYLIEIKSSPDIKSKSPSSEITDERSKPTATETKPASLASAASNKRNKQRTREINCICSSSKTDNSNESTDKQPSRAVSNTISGTGTATTDSTSGEID